MLVESWLLRAARRRPDHDALVGPGYRLSYAQLRELVDRSALRLAAADGVRAGDRIGLVLPPGCAFAIALHAILRLGAVAVPVDPLLPASERDRRLTGVRTVVSAERGGERFAIDPLGAGESRNERGAVEASPLRDAHDLDATAIVVHTSGTSGASKPIPLSYGNWLWSAIGSAAALGGPPDERWLCAMPLHHVGGLSVLLRSVIAGTTAVVHERWDTEAVLAALTGAGDPSAPAPTMVSLVPTTLRRLLDAGLRGPAVPPSVAVPGPARALRWVLLGGAAIPAGLLEDAAAAAVPVAPTYGMSEATSQIATLGPPLFCTRVRIAADTGEAAATAVATTDPAVLATSAAPDVVGEILVAGPTVSAAVVGADGWLRTGDLGRVDARGHLTVVGRTSDTIITGGENVLPLEVERVLDAYPGVTESAVFGRPDSAWGERVCAWVVAAPGAALDLDALRAFASGRLAAHQRPREVERVDALPRTPSGKILRRALG